ncbi:MULTISPECIES: DUF2244 domain-containing protein [Methylocaldum]|jgi:uncharacterized membrane protein|uniref:DUF2244 domain-containing protein n=1 Tax=unclassified Methylocaldum TaxID=2622260 RepID=UPI001AEA22C9|nr:DUF2244 domain-containing protein [Methylocaldum sp. RMAD-M]MBP1148394.1 putative membrane protein [Methylocaldum sp. RMAD-M]
MIESERDARPGSQRFVLTPNASLNGRQASFLMLGIALVMAVIAGSFASMGAWLVLPFSGAEWVLLAYCFRLGLRNCRIREVITVTETLVQLERGYGTPEQIYRFQRAWVALDWTESPIKGYPSRLSFRSHGKEIEIGRFLAEPERAALASELRKILFDSK